MLSSQNECRKDERQRNGQKKRRARTRDAACLSTCRRTGPVSMNRRRRNKATSVVCPAGKCRNATGGIMPRSRTLSTEERPRLFVRKRFPWSTRHGYTLFSCCHGRTSALFRTDGPTVASPSCRGMSPLLQKPLPSPFLRDSPPTPSASPPRDGEAAPWSRRTGGRPAWPCVRGKAFCPCRRHDR